MTTYRLLLTIAVGGVLLGFWFELRFNRIEDQIAKMRESLQKALKDLAVVADEGIRSAQPIQQIQQTVDSLAEDFYCVREFGMTHDEKVELDRASWIAGVDPETKQPVRSSTPSRIETEERPVDLPKKGGT